MSAQPPARQSGLGEVPARAGGWLAQLRQQFAPNATDEELEYFAAVARHLELDPTLQHLVLIERFDKSAGGKVHRPQITVAGRRVIAFRTGRWRGMDGPEWCGPRRYDRAGERLPLDWTEVWDDDDNYPYAARCLVYPADWSHPANGTVKWSEFAQYQDRDHTKLMPTWADLPSHMLGKTAESLALRRGFPEVQAAVDYLGDDDQALMVEVAAEPPHPPAVAAAAGPAGAPATPVGSAPVPAAARPTARPAGTTSWDRDRVPDHVYDNLPEAQAGPDNSGRRP